MKESKDNLDPSQYQLLTLKQFAEKNPWPNVTTMRNLFYKRETNGLKDAFKIWGRRIIVDEKKFFEVVKGQDG